MLRSFSPYLEGQPTVSLKLLSGTPVHSYCVFHHTFKVQLALTRQNLSIPYVLNFMAEGTQCNEAPK